MKESVEPASGTHDFVRGLVSPRPADVRRALEAMGPVAVLAADSAVFEAAAYALSRRCPRISRMVAERLLPPLLEAVSDERAALFFPVLEELACQDHPELAAVRGQLFRRAASRPAGCLALVNKLRYAQCAAALKSIGELAVLLYEEVAEGQRAELLECLAELGNGRFPQAAPHLPPALVRLLRGHRVTRHSTQLATMALEVVERGGRAAVGALDALYLARKNFDAPVEGLAPRLIAGAHRLFAERSWGVECALVEHLPSIVALFTAAERHSEILSLYSRLAASCDQLVLCALARHLSEVQHSLGEPAAALVAARALEGFPLHSTPAAEALLQNCAALLASESGRQSVVGLLRGAGEWPCAGAAVGAAEGLPAVLHALPLQAEALLEAVVSAVRKLYPAMSLCLRRRVVAASARLLRESGPARRGEDVVLLLRRELLTDEHWAVRRAALDVVGALRELLSAGDFRARVLPMLREWAAHPAFHVRQNLPFFLARFHRGLGDLLDSVWDLAAALLERDLPAVQGLAHFALQHSLAAHRPGEARKAMERRLRQWAGTRRAPPLSLLAAKPG